MRKSEPANQTLADRLISAIMPLMKASQAEVMAATSACELTLTQLRSLFVLEHHDHAMPVNALAEQLHLSVAATGRAVDAMVRIGLLSRREDERDRRIKRIGLTDAGRSAIVRMGQARREAVELFVGKLDAAERAALDIAVATLGNLVANHLPPLGGGPELSSCDCSFSGTSSEA
jgi:DNA-binding MarR family transcriptional regulator